MADYDDYGRDGPDGLVSLEEFLTACQKSLARATESAQYASRADSAFSLGERPLYVIDGIDVDLSAGVRFGHAPDGQARECVLLDFNAPVATRSSVRFRVETKPLEAKSGARLELSLLDSPGPLPRAARLRVILIDDHGAPVPRYPIQLFFAQPGNMEAPQRMEVNTDLMGQFNFTVTPTGLRETFFTRTPTMEFPGRDYFVWAVARRLGTWEAVISPPPPVPPLSLIGAGDESDYVVSGIARVRLREGE